MTGPGKATSTGASFEVGGVHSTVVCPRMGWGPGVSRSATLSPRRPSLTRSCRSWSRPSGRWRGKNLCNYPRLPPQPVHPVMSSLHYIKPLPERASSTALHCFTTGSTGFSTGVAGRSWITEAAEMSIAKTATQAMLSDALLRDDPVDSRMRSLELELPLDRFIKFVSVGLPLLLLSMAFAREISMGPQISCFPPSNLSAKQASYVDTYCWDSLMHHEYDANGNFQERSLWVHKMFPYSLLAMGVLMYLPTLIWRFLVAPYLGSDLLFVIDELDKSYNRSVRLAQSILELRWIAPSQAEFLAELEIAKRKRYFEYPLLERYMQCKQRSYFLVSMLFLRGFLLLLFMSAACLYLVYFHLSAFLQDEFSCLVRTGLLRDQTWVPELVQCKMTGLLVFQIISVANGAVYVLLAPVILFSLLRLFCWDTTFLSLYEVLPALGLISGHKLGCPLNDLNVLLLFLRANVAQLRSYGRLRAMCSLAPPQVRRPMGRVHTKMSEEEAEEALEAQEEMEEEAREAREERKHNLVDIMTVLGGAHGNVVNCKEQRPLVEEHLSLEPSHHQGYHELKETPSHSYT